MIGTRTSVGNEKQFSTGDNVRVLRGSQWHTGDTGWIVDCHESHALVSLPGPQPRTRDQEWIAVEDLDWVD